MIINKDEYERFMSFIMLKYKVTMTLSDYNVLMTWKNDDSIS